MRSLVQDLSHEGSSLLSPRPQKCYAPRFRPHALSGRCQQRAGVAHVVQSEVAPLQAVIELTVPADVGSRCNGNSNQHSQHAAQQMPVLPLLRDLPTIGLANQCVQERQPGAQQHISGLQHVAAVDVQREYVPAEQQPQQHQQHPQDPKPLQRQQSQQSQPKRQQQQAAQRHKHRAARSKTTRHLPWLTTDMKQQVSQLLSAGSCKKADDLLWAQVMRLKSLDRVQLATDELALAGLLRPAVAVALLVRLGRIVTHRQQKLKQRASKQLRQHHMLLAVHQNRQRQLRRRQRKLEDGQRRQREAARQQAEANAAAHAAAVAQQQAFLSRISGRTDSFAGGRFSSQHTSAAAAAASVSSKQDNQGCCCNSSSSNRSSSSSSSSSKQVSSGTGKQQTASTRQAAAQQQQQHQKQQKQRKLSQQLLSQQSATAKHARRLKWLRMRLQQRGSVPLMSKAAQQLLHRLAALVKAKLSGCSDVQLGLLHHWMLRLQVLDDRLAQQLHRLALQQLPVAEPRALVPVLWGLAKAEPVAAAAAARASRRPSVTALASGHTAAGTGTSGAAGSSKASPVPQQESQAAPAAVVATCAQEAAAQQQQQQQQQHAVAAAPSAASLRRPQHPKAAAQPQQQQQQQQQQQHPQPQQQQPPAGTADPSLQQTSAVAAADAPAFAAAWLEASAINLHTFSASQLASSLYSLALLKQQPPQEWLTAYFAASRDKLQHSNAQDLSNTLWALGTLQLLPPDAGWWAQFQVATTAELWKFTGTGITNLIWGAARLHLQPNSQLADLLLWQAHRQFTSMDLQLCASLAWAVAELGLKPRLHWLHRLGRRIRYLQGSLTPGLSASILLSFSSLGYCPRSWMRRFLAAVHPQLQHFSTHDIANTFTAFARMRYVPKDDWLFDFLVEARRAIPSCSAQQLLPIAHSLAVLSSNTVYRVHPDLLAAVLAQAKECAAEFSISDCLNFAQSLVYLNVAPGVGLLAALVDVYNRQAGKASAEDVAGMLWVLGAFWRGSSECLWIRQHPQLLQHLLAASQQHLAAGVYRPLQLKRVLAAVVAMGYNPGPVWLTAHETAVVAQLGDVYPATLEQVLRGYRALGYQPRQGQLLQRVLVQKQEQWQQQQQQQQQQQPQPSNALS